MPGRLPVYYSALRGTDMISYEDFEKELARIHGQIGQLLDEKNPIKRAVGSKFVEFWIKELQDLVEETK